MQKKQGSPQISWNGEVDKDKSKRKIKEKFQNKDIENKSLCIRNEDLHRDLGIKLEKKIPKRKIIGKFQNKV